MKLKIEATEIELYEKAGALIKAFSEVLRKNNIDLVEMVNKALPNTETHFNEPVMQELLKFDELAYKKQIDLMVKDINKVLDKASKGK